MSRTTWTFPVAVVLAAVLARPGAAATVTTTVTPVATFAPDPASPRHASVDIDTSDIGTEGPVIKRRTRERTDVVLRAAGVLPGRPDARDPVIHIDIDELVGTEPGYQCEVWISRDDEVLGERRRVECTLCTESEIVQRVETTVAEMVAQLPAVADEPAPATSEPSEPSPGAVPPTPSDDDPSPRLRALGKAGAALVAVGAAGAITGGVLVALPPKVDVDDPLYEVSYRPPGIATLAAGGAVLVAGVVMLVVDRRRARDRTTALVPTLGPGAAGVSVVGRF
jgi:hypothetical protein